MLPVRDLIALVESLTTDIGKSVATLVSTCGTKFDADIATAMLPLVARLTESERIELEHAQQSPNLSYSLSLLAQREKNAAKALIYADDAVKYTSQPDPFVFLQRARLRHSLGDNDGAQADLGYALSLRPAYGFYLKAEKFISRLAALPTASPRRRVRVALLSPTTTALITGPLAGLAYRDGLELDIYQSDYGTWRQDILDTKSGLYTFAPEVVVLFPPDLSGLPPDNATAEVESLVSNQRRLWETLQTHLACHVVQIGFDLPVEVGWGGLEDQCPDGRRRQLRRANLLLTENLPSGVSFLDPERVIDSGCRLRSHEEWSRFRQWPSVAALPVFCELILAHIRASQGLVMKVLVLDLDNTLWGGVIGEDGLQGIALGPPDPVGEAYQDLQDYVLELRHRGIMLAVCSKNNLSDGEAPFKQHDGMRLKRDDFVAFKCNWNDKASNIAEIAQELALGLDSFVFLDDNPLERAWVRARLPQVKVVEGGSNPWEMLSSLRAGLYFETATITSEDRARHESYRIRSELAAVQQDETDIEHFLASLSMTAHCVPVDPTTIGRITQLVNKTNQFNLCTRRYTEQQIAQSAGRQNWWWQGFRLMDRFGDHGLIGVIAAQRGDEWLIDNWLMSCRVLGRRMEEFMLATLVTAAQRDGARSLRARYLPTPKNALVSQLLPRLGFTPDGDDFVWRIDERPIPSCPFIAKGET